jgi:hypothetical protein
LLQENGISICYSGRNDVHSSCRSGVPNPGPSPQKSDVLTHYAIDDPDFGSVKLIQYRMENLSLKTLQMEDVGIFFFKENVGKILSVLI